MEYKKEGNIGDILVMDGIGEAGVVSDFKDGKVITLDADGKKHQYSVNNKKIIGYKEAVKDKPSSMADIAPKSPVIAPVSSDKKINEEELTTNPETKLEAFTGIVNTNKPYLNIREGAGFSYKVIGKLSRGSKNTFIFDSDGWYRLADRDGYVSASFIKIG